MDVLQPERRTDAVDAAVFDAMKTALDARIDELAGDRLVNPQHTLSHIQDSISELRKLSKNTRRSHKVTTAKFTKFLREAKGMDYEPALASITPDLLPEYLDYLLRDPDVKNGTISKYFDDMNSVFNHAIRTRKVPGLLVNPVKTLEMPRGDSIEERMYLHSMMTKLSGYGLRHRQNGTPQTASRSCRKTAAGAFLMVLRVLLWSGLRPVEAFWLRNHGGVTTD